MKRIKTQSQNFLPKHERGADRFATELSVAIGSIQGLARNVSATGIYFETEIETELAQQPGSRVHFTVEVNVRGKKLKLLCEGEVVRVGRNDGVLGVAAKLANSFFSEAAEVIDVNPGSRAGIH